MIGVSLIGVSPRRPSGRFSFWRRAGVATAVLLAARFTFPCPVSAQAPADEPSVSISPDTTAPSSGTEANPALPPYAPSNNSSSLLLPSSPPLPPHPSTPELSLLPDSTPRPVPPPLPIPDQTGSSLASPGAGALTNGGPGTTPATPVAGGATSTSTTANVRRFQYAFRLATGVTYDDNLFLSSDDSSAGRAAAALHGISRADTYFLIEPSVSLGYGDFLSRATNYVEFDYNAQVLIYTKNTDQDTVQHFVNLQGAYHFAQITLTLSQGLQILNSTDIGTSNSGSLLGGTSGSNPSEPNTQVNLDASRRTGLDIYTTNLTANYAFSDKTSVDLSGGYSAYHYSTLTSSDTFSGSSFFNYSPTGKLTFGLGVTGGYTIQSGTAPDEIFEQANLRLSYIPTTKLSFAGTVGVEAREDVGVSGADITPIFDFTISYAPFDSTALSLVASRRVDTSAVLTGENFDSTGFSFTVSQRFFQRVFTHLSMGYTHSSYISAVSGATTDRVDNYYYVQPGLDYSIRDNLSASVFYSHRQNLSSLSGNGFSDNQIGARLTLSF